MKEFRYFMRTGLLLLCWLGLAVSAQAQLSNLRSRQVQVNGTPMRLDSLSVLPSSIEIIGQPDSLFHLNYNLSTGTLSIQGPEAIDSVKVFYRLLPYRLDAVHQQRSLQVYDSAARFDDPLQPEVPDLRETLFQTEGVNKSGILSRGISFGNRQDVFVNSALNLSLDGKLTEDISIRGSISDQQLPYQPEGNTQQLQDFDRVFFELFGKGMSLKAGDVILQNENSHFLKYQKNVQGGQFSANYSLGEHTTAKSQIGAAIAKGKFASISIEPQEGVSGPYKLTVPQQGLWVMIMANSEKVFLNGQQLERGFDRDYVIDYNLGEITFTEKVLISRYSRIRVDFEYADRNYSRSVISAAHQQQSGKLNIHAQFYQEKDNPNRPLALDLSHEQMQELAELGDTDQALVSGVDSTGFIQDRILYERSDTLLESGERFVFYKYSTDSQKAYYQLKFTEVGYGNGNYVLQNGTLNGRVYAWVAPLQGQPQGNFEPMKAVPLPDQKQMITLGAGYELSKYEKVYGELAVSARDRNLYSNLDDENNQGQAFKVGFATVRRPLNWLQGYHWSYDLEYENDSRNFKAIDRFRSVDFERSWGLQADIMEQAEQADQLVSTSFAVEKDAENRIDYRLVYRNREQAVEGFQHHAALAKSIGRFQTDLKTMLTQSRHPELYSAWKNLYTDAYYKGQWLRPGYAFAMEQHAVRSSDSDSLTASQQNFDEHKIYLKNGDSLQLDMELYYSIRNDRLPQQGHFDQATEARTVGFNINKDFGNGRRLGALLLHRESEHQLQNLPEKEKALSARLNWTDHFFSRHLKTDLSYQLSNGRELKREFVFLQVPGGQGTHTWRDENGDGVQDLSEFYEAVYTDERNFIKVFVPSNEFVPAFSNSLQGRMSLDFPRVWRREVLWKSLLSRFSATTSWNSLKKTTEESLLPRLMPWQQEEKQEVLLALRQIWNAHLYFNRSEPWSVDWRFMNRKQKQLLSQGYEWKARQGSELSFRWTLSSLWMIKSSLAKASISSRSDYLQDRNYQLDNWKFSPEISWRPFRTLRVAAGYSYDEKLNVWEQESNEKALSHEGLLNVRYTRANSGNLDAEFRLINIDFVGKEQSALGYELLQGLRPGRNYTWRLNYQQKLINGLQLILMYDGRKSPEKAAVHTGRMQLNALF
jgi:hypothetical protein